MRFINTSYDNTVKNAKMLPVDLKNVFQYKKISGTKKDRPENNGQPREGNGNRCYVINTC